MKEQDLAGDLLDGVPAIAKFTGWSERRVYYLAENDLIPVFKVGNRWTGRRSTLRRHVDRLDHDGEAA